MYKTLYQYFPGIVNTTHDVTNSFQETFTMTSTDCNVTLITPDPYLKIGATRSVGTSNNVFWSALHEGVFAIDIQAFSNSNSACPASITYAMTSDQSSFIS